MGCRMTSTVIQAALVGLGTGLWIGAVMAMVYFKKPGDKMGFWIQMLGFSIFCLASVALVGSLILSGAWCD